MTAVLAIFSGIVGIALIMQILNYFKARELEDALGETDAVKRAKNAAIRQMIVWGILLWFLLVMLHELTTKGRL